MNLSDILIHVNETLNTDQQHALEDVMRGVRGVVAPRFNPGMNHLLLVAFDPDATSAFNLLTRVRSLGYHAQLVGT
jgi:hypothetical protein